jgi:superfamily II DNA/RNA helicase
VTATPIIGNVNVTRQVEKLREKPHIIVGSPGRILELIKKKKISAHTIKTIVIDEADRLMDVNNLDIVKAIIKTTLKERQLMLFSATITATTEKLALEFMKEAEVIRLESKQTIPPSISHWYFETEQRDKLDVLIKLVRILNPQRAIVFLNKSDELDIITSKLKFNQLKAEGIHGTSVKLDRQKAMEDFKAGRLQLLVASDIAARGLDIQGVTHIFNMDIPEDPKHYLHRVGRTGRTGKEGLALSIATLAEIDTLKKYEKVYGIEILPREMYSGKVIPAGTRPVVPVHKKKIKDKASDKTHKPATKPAIKSSVKKPVKKQS